MRGTIKAMNRPEVTIAVIQRERFSFTQESLDSLYENTDLPFHLIYIDGASPAATNQYLQKQSKERGFELIRVENFLQPNQARNLALQHTKTPAPRLWLGSLGGLGMQVQILCCYRRRGEISRTL